MKEVTEFYLKIKLDREAQDKKYEGKVQVCGCSQVIVGSHTGRWVWPS